MGSPQRKVSVDPRIKKKRIPIDALLANMPRLTDVEFWREINPSAPITDFVFKPNRSVTPQTSTDTDAYISQLQEERYFQTPVLVPTELLLQMRQCVDAVTAAGFHATFALVYDVFYEAMSYHYDVLSAILGKDYQLVPDFWIYNIAPTEDDQGFSPHRDTEYLNTIDENGVPMILTAWMPMTDATPLNSCMYVLPAHRDQDYHKFINSLERPPLQPFPLEDIRAIRTGAGTLSCWDQYLLHWGSRSSNRATEPRISCAYYYQRGDIPPIGGSCIDFSKPLTFAQRLALVCRGMYKYSSLRLEPTEENQPVRDFLAKQAELVPISHLPT